MIRNLTIQGYKSIQNLDLELGQVNVLIGPNGSGKSSILEGIQPHLEIYRPEEAMIRDHLNKSFQKQIGLLGQGLSQALHDLEKKRFDHIHRLVTRIDQIDDVSLVGRIIQFEYLDYYPAAHTILDHSVNAGILFQLVYWTLLISPRTPSFFAIEHVDKNLAPSSCTQLMQDIVTLAKEYEKQVILTAYNPAILDGLNLHDDEQRLFVVFRNIDGHTRIRRIVPRNVDSDLDPVRLSEACIRGYLGGM